MKYFIFILFLTSCGFRTHQIETQQKRCTRRYEKLMDLYVYSNVDEMPLYPGGMNSLSTFFLKHLAYPPRDENKALQTRLFLTFIVDTLGNVIAPGIDKKTKRDYSPLDMEALRLAKLMLKWEPGKCNGEKVPVRVTFPIMISPQM